MVLFTSLLRSKTKSTFGVHVIRRIGLHFLNGCAQGRKNAVFGYGCVYARNFPNFFTASAAQSPKRLAWNRPCSDRGQMNPRVYSVQRQILPNFVLIGQHLGEWIWRPKILLQAHNRGQPFPSGHGYRLRFFSTDPPPPMSDRSDASVRYLRSPRPVPESLTGLRNLRSLLTSGEKLSGCR